MTLAGTTTLAGCVIALDTAVRNLVRSGIPLPVAVAAAEREPVGDARRRPTAAGSPSACGRTWSSSTTALRVRRVMRGGEWFDGAGTS